jgi:hypothetical protein
MSRFRIGLLAGAVIAGAPGSAWAQNPNHFSDKAAGAAPYRGSARLYAEKMRAAVRQAENEYSVLKARVENGITPAPELAAAETRLVQVIADLREAESAARRERVVEVLRQPVSVQMRDASLQQAGNTLQQAAGIQITVDKDVPPDTRLTVEARQVPLATVLESISTQANLMIRPAPEGIQLSVWPQLTVNGNHQRILGNLAPWSDEWGRYPLGDAPRVELLPQAFPSPAPAVGTMPGMPGMPPAAALAAGASVASLGERLVVVAEPGVEPSGAPGLWLTVYRWDGGRLLKVGTMFHRSRAAEPQAGAMGGAGGFEGRLVQQPVHPGAAGPTLTPSPAGEGNFGAPLPQPGVGRDPAGAVAPEDTAPVPTSVVRPPSPATATPIVGAATRAKPQPSGKKPTTKPRRGR